MERKKQGGKEITGEETGHKELITRVDGDCLSSRYSRTRYAFVNTANRREEKQKGTTGRRLTRRRYIRIIDRRKVKITKDEATLGEKIALCTSNVCGSRINGGCTAKMQ